MALKLNLETTKFGVPAPEAYARITNFHCNKNQLQVQVAVYFSQEAVEGNSVPVSEHAHYIAVADLSGDILPAIYNVLKTLPQYEGAQDC